LVGTAGMLVGLTRFLLTRRYLSPVNPAVPVNTRLLAWLPVIAFALAGLFVAALVLCTCACRRGRSGGSAGCCYGCPAPPEDP
jgi:hypothetical protein